MDSKNALYCCVFCGGVVLGVAGTLAFLWFWEEPEENYDIPEPSAPHVKKETTLPKTVDKSSIDNAPFETENVDYTRFIDAYGDIVGELYTGVGESDGLHAPDRITDEEFQDLASDGHYDTKEYTVYSDGIMADSTTDETISESDAFAALGPNYTVRKLQRIFAIGVDSDLDAIYVRNDRLYTLYEITTDERTYKEVTGRGD